MLLFILMSCIAVEKPSNNFSTMLNASKLRLENQLISEGGYQRISEHSLNHGTDYKNGLPTRYVAVPYAEKPLFFFDDGLVCYDMGLSLDSVDYNTWIPEFAD